MPRAGQFRHRITVQQAAESKNVVQETERAWSTYAERWARLEEAGGTRTFAAEQVAAQRTRTYVLRNDAVSRAITTTMRVVDEAGVTFRITLSDDPDGRRREWRLVCEEALNP